MCQIIDFRRNRSKSSRSHTGREKARSRRVAYSSLLTKLSSCSTPETGRIVPGCPGSASSPNTVSWVILSSLLPRRKICLISKSARWPKSTWLMYVLTECVFLGLLSAFFPSVIPWYFVVIATRAFVRIREMHVWGANMSSDVGHSTESTTVTSAGDGIDGSAD